MYRFPSFNREEAEQDFIFENRLMRATGLSQEEAEFIPNIGNDWYEIGVVTDNGVVTTWFTDWNEARKFVMNKFPEKKWEESGWILH